MDITPASTRDELEAEAVPPVSVIYTDINFSVGVDRLRPIQRFVTEFERTGFQNWGLLNDFEAQTEKEKHWWTLEPDYESGGCRFEESKIENRSERAREMLALFANENRQRQARL